MVLRQAWKRAVLMAALREVIYGILFCPSAGGLLLGRGEGEGGGGGLIDGVVVHAWSLTALLPCLNQACTWLVPFSLFSRPPKAMYPGVTLNTLNDISLSKLQAHQYDPVV